MLSTLSLGLLALVSAKPQPKGQRLVAHETTVPTLYSEPTICYGDDECRGKEVCDMGTYTCREETDTPTIWTTPSPSAPNGCCYGDSYKANDKCAMAVEEGKCAEKDCSWRITDDPSDCLITTTTTTTPTTTETAEGCCHGDSYKGNDKCTILEDQVGCERKSCTWLETTDPNDCVITTTTSTPTTTDVGCCKGTSYLSNAECNQGETEKTCGRKCEWITGGVLAEDCVITTSSSPTTTIEVGCCKGSDAKTDSMCNPKADSNSCERSNSCTWINGGILGSGICQSPTLDEPGCCYGDTAKTYEMCLEKETVGDCDRSGKCEWRKDASEDEPAVCDLPTTTSTSTPTTTHVELGCCYSESYKANGKCAMALTEGKCADKGCSWLITEDITDCEITTTKTIDEEGCCHGDSYKANDKCLGLEDQVGCERKSCTWKVTTDPSDCVITTTTSEVVPGCCYGNPAAAYSSRWMDTCKTFGTEKECTLLLHDDGTPRCVFEPLGEYEDCETVWPTTTTTTAPTTTETAEGCCHGDSYKANDKCVGLEDQVGCERKSCTWLLTTDPKDCVITTTSSPTTTIEVGCCKGPDPKSNAMCNAKTDRSSCERSNSCEFIVNGSNDKECLDQTIDETGCCYGDTAKTHEMCLEKEDDKEGCERSGKCEWRKDISPTEDAVCDLPTTTSTPWLGAKAAAQQQSRKKNNHRQEEAMMFGGAGSDTVVGQAMQYQVSLSSVVLMLVAAFALYQTYAWMSARKNKDYAAVQNQNQYYQSA